MVTVAAASTMRATAVTAASGTLRAGRTSAIGAIRAAPRMPMRSLPLSTMGLLQYLSPSVQFLLAVLVYGEAFTAARAVAFTLIWLALAVFAVHSFRRRVSEPVLEP